MANTGRDTSKSFFASALSNRMALIPGAGSLTTYGNGTDGATAAAAYNSRVLASQTNGAGPTVAPINAPFSFVDFATGKKTLTTAGTSPTGSGKRRSFKR